MEENPYQPPQNQIWSSPARRPAVPRLVTMTPQELFGVVVRATGLWWAAHSAWTATGAVAPVQGSTSLDYLVPCGIGFGLGIAILFGADKIVALSYGASSHEEIKEDQQDEES